MDCIPRVSSRQQRSLIGEDECAPLATAALHAATVKRAFSFIEELDFTILQQIKQIGKWMRAAYVHAHARVSRDGELFLAAMFVQDIVRTDGIFVRV